MTDGSAQRRRSWALAIIGKALGDVPEYGSEAWLALPETSPERIAAVVIAAEGRARDVEADAWWHSYEVSIAAYDAAQLKAAEDAAFVEAAKEHETYWSGAAEAMIRRSA